MVSEFPKDMLFVLLCVNPRLVLGGLVVMRFQGVWSLGISLEEVVQAWALVP